MEIDIKTLSRFEINSFCFGTMQRGGKADRAAAKRLYQIFLANCINHFDTACSYCKGTAEKFLGDFCDKDRDELLIATKASYVKGAPKANILAQFNQYQPRVKMDVIDVLYLHRFNSKTSLDKTLDTFAELKQSGKMRYVGIYNFSAWQGIDTINHEKLFGLSIDFFQPMYSLVKRQSEVEILPMCAVNKITVTTYSHITVGLLTGNDLRDERGRLVEDSRYALRYKLAFMRDTAKKLCDLADTLRTDPETLAVAWMRSHPKQLLPIVSVLGRINSCNQLRR